MPGSLNYSPSGSEGGRSLGGGGGDPEKGLIGVDLTTTPGTTPLKWRKRRNSGSSEGRSVSVAEERSTAATAKDSGQGQDGVPPRIATRKFSWDPHKPPVTNTSDPIDNPAQPAKVPAASFTGTTNGTVEPTSHQGSVASPGLGFVVDREPQETTSFSEDLRHAGRRGSRRGSDEGGRHKNPSSLLRRASAAAEEIAAALAKGAKGAKGAAKGAAAPNQREAPDSLSCQEEEEGQRPKKSSHTEHVSEPTVLDGDVSRHHSHSSADFTTDTTIRGAEESVSMNATREQAAGIDVDREHTRQPDVNLGVEDTPPGVEEGRGFSCDEGRGSDNHNINGSMVVDGNPKVPSAPSGEPSTRADKEIGKLPQATTAAAAVEGEEELENEIGQNLPSEVTLKSQGGKRRSHPGRVGSMGVNIVRDSDNPRQDTETSVGIRPRASDRRDVAIDRGVHGDIVGDTRAEGIAHAVRIEPVGQVESVVEGDRRAYPSADEDILLSPPMLSRRRSGRTSESVMGLNKDNAVRELAVNTRGGREQVHEGAEVDHLRLDYPGSGERISSAPGPPALTPTRERPKRTSAAEEAVSPAVLLTPHSPIAIAARAVSQEESIHSTLRMKRAAEAIAREDAQLMADAERREQRTKPSSHRAALPAHSNHEDYDSSIKEEDDEEEEARARHSEKMRVRALRAMAAREEAEIERDRALELTLEVLRRRQADKRRGMGRAQPLPGKRRTHSPRRRSRTPRHHGTSLARSVKDSAARSCGLSPAQVILLRRSRQLGGDSDRNKAMAMSESRREELAEAKEERPATRTRNPATEALVDHLTKRMTDKEKRAFLHACLEDARECTHKPRTRSTAARRVRGAEGSGGGEGGEEAKDGQGAASNRDAFLYRVDAQERAKTAAMEHRRGELAYKAVLDKRVCPGCGAEQSYDEVLEKRRICPNCEVEYRKPKTWAGVRKDFLKRVDDFQESKWQALQSANEFKETQMRMMALGVRQYSRDGVLESESEMEERQRLFWEDIEDDFIARLQEDAARRQVSLKSRSAALYQDWTFQPTLTPASQRVVGESAWAGMTFLERMEGDLQRRREATPHQQPGYNNFDFEDNVFDG